MSFVSAAFVVLYLVALALRCTLGRSRSLYIGGLLALSWVFYAWHTPSYLVLILVSTTIDYGAARAIDARPQLSLSLRRGLLVASLTLNLGILAVFKYAGFLIETFAHSPETWSLSSLALPIGISFYTFQSMSYTIDVYHGRLPAERSFVRLACYIAFFPQLVAGPIVRARDFLYQLDRRRRMHFATLTEGGYLIIRGLFLKLVVADNLGQIVDAHWQDAAQGGAQDSLALALLVFFACQLFCDFAGYTDIARGLAYPLGFRLPINFDAPYLAATFTSFWRRWHITLSSWFRDYLYIPLGGNRRGNIGAIPNLFVVMVVAGLWHGANWTFVLWGAVHGAAVAVERTLGLAQGARNPVVRLAWYVVVQVTWILSMGLFRADDATQGWQIVRNAFADLIALPSNGLGTETAAGLLGLGWWFTVPVVALHARSLISEVYGIRRPNPYEKAAYAGAMLAATLMLYTSSRQFIYFQF